MKAVFTTPTIKPRSTAQTIPGSQTPRLGRPTRKADQPTAGRRRVDSVAAGVVVDRAEGGQVGVAEVEGAGVEAAAAVAIFRGEGNPTAIVRVEGPASRTVNPVDPTREDPIKGDRTEHPS
jgi:hypothetical protein